MGFKTLLKRGRSEQKMKKPKSNDKPKSKSFRSALSLMDPRRLVRSGTSNKESSAELSGGLYSTSLTRQTKSRNLLQTAEIMEDEMMPQEWLSSAMKSYHKHAPLIVLRPTPTHYTSGTTTSPMLRKSFNSSTSTASINSYASDSTNPAIALGAMMSRSRQLPYTTRFSNNHIMVNLQRQERAMAPLTRRVDLDRLAKEHAQVMADNEELSSVTQNPSQLEQKLQRPTRRMGVNLGVGKTIDEIHQAMKESKSDMNNMLDRRYTQMGMGTAMSSKGNLYLCQIYHG